MTDEEVIAAIDRAQRASGDSVRSTAARAGMSDTRWRQIVVGGSAPTVTMIAMALAVGLSPEALWPDADAMSMPELIQRARDRMEAGPQRRRSVGPDVDDADSVQLSIPPEALEGLNETERLELKQRLKGDALRIAREIKQAQ